MAYFVHHLKEHSDNPTFFHFVGASPASTDINKTLRRLCEEIRLDLGLWVTINGTFILPTALNLWENDDFQSLSDKFAEILHAAAKSLGNKKLVIVIDAVNQIQEDNNNHGSMLKWIPLKLPANVKVILSCLYACPAIDVCKARGYPILEIGQLAVRDRQEIVTQLLRHHNKRLDTSQVT